MPSPTLHLPGGGDKFWIVGDNMTFKIGGAQTRNTFALAESLIAPGGGPPAHIHHREDEVFFVIEGQFEFSLADTTYRRGPGAALFLPRGVPHRFQNVGDAFGRFLVMTCPSGFEHFVAECGEAVESIPHEKTVGHADIEKLLAGCGKYGLELLPPGSISFAKAGAAPQADRRVWCLGHKIHLKLTAGQTGGALTLVEIESPAGPVVPPHAHREMDEYFYVLSGQFRFTVDGKTIDAPAGTFLHVPPGIFHSFTNAGPGTARLIDIHTPGGFDRFFEEAGTPASDEVTPPNLPPPDPAALFALLDRHGMDGR